MPKNGFCIAAVTMHDIYPDDTWNFVFGLASSDRGVFSFNRLMDES